MTTKIICPHCNKLVEIEATSCPHCAQSLDKKNDSNDDTVGKVFGFTGAIIAGFIIYFTGTGFQEVCFCGSILKFGIIYLLCPVVGVICYFIGYSLSKAFSK